MTKRKTKLTSIEIGGFKSIAYDKPLRLMMSDINILLGANGAGKTNIISFFRMLGFMMSGTLQKHVAEKGTSSSFLNYGPKRTPRLYAKLKFQDEKNVDAYEIELSHAAGNRLIITDEKLSWERCGDDNPLNVQIENNFHESGLINSDDKVSKIIRTLLSRCKAYQFHDTSQDGYLRQSSTVKSARYLQSRGNNLASFLYLLKNEFHDEYQRIVSYVQMVMPSFADFVLAPIGDYIQLNWEDNCPNDYVFSADQFSDGTIRFIALATLLLQPAELMPSVIIIDEPELGLHPYAISQLIEMIGDASLHAQIIISTQSPQLIDGFSADNVTVVEMAEGEHSTIAHQLSEEALSEWLKDYQLSELWNKNIIGGRPV